MPEVGDKIRILSMDGEPQYSGREGVVQRISRDPYGDIELRGTWGGLSVYIGKDNFEIVEKGTKE